MGNSSRETSSPIVAQWLQEKAPKGNPVISRMAVEITKCVELSFVLLDQVSVANQRSRYEQTLSHPSISYLDGEFGILFESFESMGDYKDVYFTTVNDCAWEE